MKCHNFGLYSDRYGMQSQRCCCCVFCSLLVVLWAPFHLPLPPRLHRFINLNCLRVISRHHRWSRGSVEDLSCFCNSGQMSFSDRTLPQGLNTKRFKCHPHSIIWCNKHIYLIHAFLQTDVVFMFSNCRSPSVCVHSYCLTWLNVNISYFFAGGRLRMFEDISCRIIHNVEKREYALLYFAPCPAYVKGPRCKCVIVQRINKSLRKHEKN